MKVTDRMWRGHAEVGRRMEESHVPLSPSHHVLETGSWSLPQRLGGSQVHKSSPLTGKQTFDLYTGQQPTIHVIISLTSAVSTESVNIHFTCADRQHIQSKPAYAASCGMTTHSLQLPPYWQQEGTSNKHHDSRYRLWPHFHFHWLQSLSCHLLFVSRKNLTFLLWLLSAVPRPANDQYECLLPDTSCSWLKDMIRFWSRSCDSMTFDQLQWETTD